MPKESDSRRTDAHGSGKGKGGRSKDSPGTACIVCGSEEWCDCEWDHFYGEPIVEQETEPG